MQASAATSTTTTERTLPKARISRSQNNYKQFSNALTYLSVIALIISIVSVGYQSPVDERRPSAGGVAAKAMELEAPSVDQIVAANLAATTAEMADLSIASNVSNLSISLNAKGEMAQNNDTVLSKPQIIEAGDGSILINYRVKAGDTVPSVASRYGISAQTLRWANDLTSDALEADTNILVPSTDGVVYTVRSGDTLESIAGHYKADKDRIVAYNNLELTSIRAGKRLLLPGGILPVDERPVEAPVAPAPSSSSSSGSVAAYGYNAASVGNRYSYGYCTWYAYQRRAELGRPIGSFWGDAVTWAGFASSSGYAVNNSPAVGSVLHDPNSAPPYGHVAVVENVYGDGSIRVSEMNYVGWNVVSYRTISAAEARGYSYIH